VFIGKVAATFTIGTRGCVVETDCKFRQLPSALRLKIGDDVVFRFGDQEVLRTPIAGIEHFSPWSPELPFCFLLPPTVTRDSVVIGSEVWTS
jgi:hypothetical protein